MALTKEQIEKYRSIYANSTNDLAKKTAKEKLEAAGVPLTEPKGSEKKSELSKEQIEKYRSIYANSTNDLAKKTAKEKLEAAGVPLSETKKEEKKETKKEESEKKTGDAHPMFRYKSKDDYKDAVSKVLINNHALDEGRVKEMFEHAKIKTIFDEAYSEKWQAKLAASQMKAAELKRAKMKSKGKEEEFDCEELIAKAKEQRKRQQERYEQRKKTEPKTHAGKTKSTIEKTVEKVDKDISTRAKKGKVTTAEIEKAIAVHRDAIKRLEALLKKIKSGKKFADGGNVDDELDADDAKEFDDITSGACGCGGKMARGGVAAGSLYIVYDNDTYESLIEKPVSNRKAIQIMNEIDLSKYESGVGMTELSEWRKWYKIYYKDRPVPMARGGKASGWKHKSKKRKLDPETDNQFSAEKSGTRISRKYASVETRGGGVYHRRNANQFGKVKGGNEYREYRENRTDTKRYLEKGGKVSGWKHKAKKISKEVIKMRLLKPQGDFFMEKIDPYTYKLHFTPNDAFRAVPVLSKYFDVKASDNGYHGSAYIVKNR